MRQGSRRDGFKYEAIQAAIALALATDQKVVVVCASAAQARKQMTAAEEFVRQARLLGWPI